MKHFPTSSKLDTASSDPIIGFETESEGFKNMRHLSPLSSRAKHTKSASIDGPPSGPRSLPYQPPPPKVRQAKTLVRSQQAARKSLRSLHPLLFGPQEWHWFHQYPLPGLYKTWYALRRMPNLMVAVFRMTIPFKWILDPPSFFRWALGDNPQGRKTIVDRLSTGGGIHTFLMGNDFFILEAVNDVIRPWGMICNATGPSNYPTFTGKREFLYASWNRAGGRGLRIGEMISFSHPTLPGANMVKRVRAKGGEICIQPSGLRGNYMARVKVCPLGTTVSSRAIDAF